MMVAGAQVLLVLKHHRGASWKGAQWLTYGCLGCHLAPPLALAVQVVWVGCQTRQASWHPQAWLLIATAGVRQGQSYRSPRKEALVQC